MWTYFVKGGFLMWPLLGFSIFSVAIIIERLLFFHRVARVDTQFVEKVRLLVRDNNTAGALRLCEKYRSPVTAILKKGIIEYRDGNEIMQKAMEQAGIYEIPKLEKYLPILAAIASIATLVGFTGTVLGMIRAFNSIAASGVSSPTVVAKGISEALITTATGLLIAAPTLLFYYYFSHRADRIMTQIEQVTKEMSSL
jgi:biopolymer transport protein ExbB